LVSLVREFAPLCDVIPGTNSSGWKRVESLSDSI
jgi:hypothetical protein